MYASSRSLLLSDSEYDIHCSLFLQNMSLKRLSIRHNYEEQMKGSKYLYTPDCTAISVFTVLWIAVLYDIAIDVTLNFTSPLSLSSKLDGVILV